MTPIPTVTLSDDQTMPVLGISVTELSPEAAERTVTCALEAGYPLDRRLRRRRHRRGCRPGDRGVGCSSRRAVHLDQTRDRGPGLSVGTRHLQNQPRTVRAGLRRPLSRRLAAEQNGKYIDAWGGLMKTKEVGQTKSIGISNFNAEQLSDLVDLTYTVPGRAPAGAASEAQSSRHAGRSRREVDHHPGVQPARGRCATADPTVVTVAAAHGKSPAQVLIRGICSWATPSSPWIGSRGDRGEFRRVRLRVDSAEVGIDYGPRRLSGCSARRAGGGRPPQFLGRPSSNGSS